MTTEHDCGLLDPGIYLCRECVGELYRLLRYGVDLMAQLEITAQREDNVGRGGIATHAAVEAQLPFRTAASLARDRLRTILLRAWGYPAAVWATMIDGPDILNELRAAIDRGNKMVDIPEERVRYGNCGQCRRPITAPAGETFYECDCGYWYDLTHIRDKQILNAWEAWAPAPVIVKALRHYRLGIGVKSIEGWGRRGKIEKRMKRGTPVYCVAEVYDHAQRMKRIRTT